MKTKYLSLSDRTCTKVLNRVFPKSQDPLQEVRQRLKELQKGISEVPRKINETLITVVESPVDKENQRYFDEELRRATKSPDDAVFRKFVPLALPEFNDDHENIENRKRLKASKRKQNRIIEEQRNFRGISSKKLPFEMDSVEPITIQRQTKTVLRTISPSYKSQLQLEKSPIVDQTDVDVDLTLVDFNDIHNNDDSTQLSFDIEDGETSFQIDEINNNMEWQESDAIGMMEQDNYDFVDEDGDSPRTFNKSVPWDVRFRKYVKANETPMTTTVSSLHSFIAPSPAAITPFVYTQKSTKLPFNLF